MYIGLNMCLKVIRVHCNKHVPQNEDFESNHVASTSAHEEVVSPFCSCLIAINHRINPAL